MMDDDNLIGILFGMVFILIIALTLSTMTCSKAVSSERCSENLRRHSPTAADTVSFVRQGCYLMPLKP